jgi:hypothetical protein
LESLKLKLGKRYIDTFEEEVVDLQTIQAEIRALKGGT